MLTPRTIVWFSTYLTFISTHAQQVPNTNHHILFLLANVTPSDDFKGTMQRCGFEAAARVASGAGYKVRHHAPH